MKNLFVVLAVFLMGFHAFGCGDDSSPNNTKTLGIVAGSDGLLVWSSTNGMTWSQMDVPDDLSHANFSGVAFSPGEPDKVWVASSEPPALMTSTNAGETWERYEGEFGKCIPVLVEAVDAETAWVSCSCADCDQPSALKTVDGGKTWTVQDAGSPITRAFMSLQGLSVVSSEVVWMSGNYGSASLCVLRRTIDGGASWESKVKPDGGADQLPPDQSCQAVAATSANEAWVVTAHNNLRGGSVYYTTDGGDTWTLQEKEPVGGLGDLNDVRTVGGVVWIAADFGTALRSPDGGETWEKYNTEANGYNVGVAALSATTAWTVSTAYSGLGTISHTTDNGETWSHQAYPPRAAEQVLHDVAFEEKR